MKKSKFLVVAPVAFFLVMAQGSYAAAPVGGVTQVSGNTIVGWACDPDTPNSPVIVDFYANGEFGGDSASVPSWGRYKGGNTYADHYAGGIYASLATSQGGASCGGGNHGFSFTIPQSFRSSLGPGQHSIHVFMRDTTVGANPKMAGTPILLTVTGSQTPISPWYNNIAHPCRAVQYKSWKRGEAQSQYTFKKEPIDCSVDYPGINDVNLLPKFWVLSSTNEDVNSLPFYDTLTTSFDFNPGEVAPGYSVPMWNVNLQPNSGGGYRVAMSLDKINALSEGTKLDTFSGGFFQTEVGASSPDLGSNSVFFEIWYRVRAHESASMLQADAKNMSNSDFSTVQASGNLQSKTRFTVGLNFSTGIANDITRIIEVNLERSANFDLCKEAGFVHGTTILCEDRNRFSVYQANDVGLYDQRSEDGHLTYFDVNQLHRVAGLPQPSATDGDFKRVVISLNSLLRNVQWTNNDAFPMLNGMANLNGQKLTGFYIGNEIWGKGRMWVEFERLNIYTFKAY